jgi:hypothetical protein
VCRVPFVRLFFFFPIFIKRNLGCLLRCCELCIRWRAISKLPCHFRNYVVHAADGRHPPPPPCTLSAAYRRVYTGGSCLFVASHHRVLPPFAPLTWLSGVHVGSQRGPLNRQPAGFSTLFQQQFSRHTETSRVICVWDGFLLFIIIVQFPPPFFRPLPLLWFRPIFRAPVLVPLNLFIWPPHFIAVILYTSLEFSFFDQQQKGKKESLCSCPGWSHWRWIGPVGGPIDCQCVCDWTYINPSSQFCMAADYPSQRIRFFFFSSLFRPAAGIDRAYLSFFLCYIDYAQSPCILILSSTDLLVMAIWPATLRWLPRHSTRRLSLAGALSRGVLVAPASAAAGQLSTCKLGKRIELLGLEEWEGSLIVIWNFSDFAPLL